jgi:hypothetical protein
VQGPPHDFIRPNKWIVAIWVLACLLGAVDLFVALKSANGDLTHPNSQILTAGSRVLLAVGLVILYSSKLRPAMIAAAVAALVLAICLMLVPR